jgi:hypothetical protein
VTALLDVSTLKWRTPASLSRTSRRSDAWNKEEFETLFTRDSETARAVAERQAAGREMEALFREELAHEQKMFAAEKHFGQVGAFEGAMYEARGYYRPEIDCIMFPHDRFCKVCRDAIVRVIKMYSNPS